MLQPMSVVRSRADLGPRARPPPLLTHSGLARRSQVGLSVANGDRCGLFPATSIGSINGSPIIHTWYLFGTLGHNTRAGYRHLHRIGATCPCYLEQRAPEAEGLSKARRSVSERCPFEVS